MFYRWKFLTFWKWVWTCLCYVFGSSSHKPHHSLIYKWKFLNTPLKIKTLFSTLLCTRIALHICSTYLVVILFFYLFFLKQLPSKDFGKEIRGAMDVQKYLNNMVLLMDLHESSPDEIVNAILHKMLDSSENKNCFDQARAALFTHDRGNIHWRFLPQSYVCVQIQSKAHMEGQPATWVLLLECNIKLNWINEYMEVTQHCEWAVV